MGERTIDLEAFNRFEADGWERTARAYHDFFAPITGQTIDALLEAADVTARTRVLDVACGPGYVAGRAAERGAHATGVDVATRMVELGRAAYPQVVFEVGDGEALPFDPAAFDAVVGNFAIMHIGRPERAAAECGRVLAPGGRIALTAWDVPERCPLFGLLLDAVADVGTEPPEGIPAGPDFFRYGHDEAFAALLEGAGFGDVRVDAVGFEQVFEGPDELWDGLTGATVRTAPLVLEQTRDVQRRIRAAFDRGAEAYVGPEGMQVPVSVKLASGVRR